MVHAFITSKLDFSNSLLLGLPDTLVRKLQVLQGAAAHLTVKLPKHSHKTPMLSDNARVAWSCWSFSRHWMNWHQFLHSRPAGQEITITPFTPFRHLKWIGCAKVLHREIWGQKFQKQGMTTHDSCGTVIKSILSRDNGKLYQLYKHLIETKLWYWCMAYTFSWLYNV